MRMGGRAVCWMLISSMLSAMLGCTPQATRIDAVPRPVLREEQIVYRRPQTDVRVTSVPPAVDPRTQITPPPPPPAPQARIKPMSADWVVAGGPKWTHIIVHHSSETRGNAAIFDRAHKLRGYDELGYHFVITNGKGGTDGNVEVGSRWPIQKHGAHTRVSVSDDNYWNRYGIGICLVGNFNDDRPSRKQLESAAHLIAYLQQQYNIPDRNILGHGQVPGAKTDCPGRLFPYSELMHRARAVDQMARASVR